MITLTEAMKRDIANAFAEGHPVIVAGVTPDCEPTISFRGTAQPWGDSAIAFWIRKPEESEFVASIAVHPTVALVYSNMANRRHYRFLGKARLVDDPEINRQVYDNSHEFERRQDPDRRGKAVIVELTAVRGRGEDGPFVMTAS
ncbi:MAG: hypothetical protein Kow0010_10120 [Dehalococcoidia bacterium]